VRALLAAALLLSASPRAAGQCGPLFVVERSVNANVVVYEAVRAPGGVVDPKRPVHGHWRMWAEDGRMEELNALEKRLAYGIDVLGTGAGGGVEIAVRALRDRRIEVRTAEECPTARMSIQGQPAVLRRVFVQVARGAFFLPKVSYVELHGEVAESRAPVDERIDVSGCVPPPPPPAPRG
jgi:hypothetical protein